MRYALMIRERWMGPSITYTVEEEEEVNKLYEQLGHLRAERLVTEAWVTSWENRFDKDAAPVQQRPLPWSHFRMHPHEIHARCVNAHQTGEILSIHGIDNTVWWWGYVEELTETMVTVRLPQYNDARWTWRISDLPWVE